MATNIVLRLQELVSQIFQYQNGCIEPLAMPMEFNGAITSVVLAWHQVNDLPETWAKDFLAHLEIHSLMDVYAAHCPTMFTPLVMESLAGNGCVDTIAKLQRYGIQCSKRAVKVAAQNGHLSVLQFLHDHYLRAEEWSLHTMDKAASRGHLNIVKFLHHQRNEGCTTSAMDLAALGGYIDIVQFLHTMRREGCSTNAIRNAAKEGHLNIVQYLHHNRIEGCTKEALNMAAAAGHLDVVEWLVENRKEGVLSEALEYAARHGHVNVVAFLHTKQLKSWRRRCERAILAAASNGHLSVVRYFYDMQRDDLPPLSWCSVHMQALLTPRRTNGIVIGLL